MGRLQVVEDLGILHSLLEDVALLHGAAPICQPSLHIVCPTSVQAVVV